MNVRRSPSLHFDRLDLANRRHAAQARVQRSFRDALRHFVVLAAGLMLVAPAALAEMNAEDDDPFDRPGFYIGVGGSYQLNAFQNDIEDELQKQLEAARLELEKVSRPGSDYDPARASELQYSTIRDLEKRIAEGDSPEAGARLIKDHVDSDDIADVVARFVPYFEQTIVPDLKAGKTVLIAAHGNSLRALVKYLDGMSDDDIVSLNIPTGIPLLYELDDNLKPTVAGGRYLDPEAAAAGAAAVAAQGAK